MELECKCYSLWHATDECETKREKCLIHGPQGTESKKIAYLKAEHFRVKSQRQEVLDDLRGHISKALSGGTLTSDADIPGAIIAALLWVRKENHGNMPSPPEDTYERSTLKHSYHIDPEDPVKEEE